MPDLPKNKKLVPISQAAEILGVSIDTVRRWDKAGLVHASRPNGKTRYFSVDELEKIKLSKPLSISEAAERLSISQSTLRRLDKKGLIKAERDKNGERMYTHKALENFLNSEYFLRQKEVQEKILEPLKEPEQVVEDEILKEELEKNPTSPVAKQMQKFAFENRKLISRLSTFMLENRKSVLSLLVFKRIFYSAGLFLITLFIIITTVITVFFFLLPEDTAKFFGYQRRAPPLAAGSNREKSNLSKTQVALSQEKGKKDGDVLGAAYPINEQKIQQSVLGEALKPFSKVSLNIVKQIDEDLYNRIVPGAKIQDVNDILTIDKDGNITPLYNIKLPDSSYLKIPDSDLVNNLNADYIHGRRLSDLDGDIAIIQKDGSILSLKVGLEHITPNSVNSLGIIDSSVTTVDLSDGAITTIKLANSSVTSEKLAPGLSILGDDSVTTKKIKDGEVNTADLANGAVTGAKIADNTIDATDLVGTLTFADGDFIDLGAILHDDSALQGLRLPNASSASPTSPTSGEGFLAYDTSGNQVIVYNGSSWTQVGSGDITSVTAGNGLSGGGTSGDLSLAVALTTSGTTGSTSSNSGLEVSSSGLTLLKGCSDGQLLEYTDAGGWACASDDTGGAGGGSSNWRISSGAISPVNDTLDLLIGSTASSSAKFAVLNVNSGTPTASISANSGNNATYLTGLGVLSTTNMQALTLGGSTTGNIVIDSGSGAITLSDPTTVTSNLTVQGTTGVTLSGNDADITFSGTGNHDITASSGTLRLGALTLTGAITGGGQNITGLGTINGLAITADTGVITTGTWNGTAVGTAYGGLGANVTAAGGGEILYSTGTTTYDSLAAGSSGYVLTSGGTGAPSWTDPNSSSFGLWQTLSGSIQPKNQTQDLLLGGIATTSAKIGFINVNSGTPIATLSAGTNSGLYLTAAGKIATEAKQNLTLGDSTTTGSVIINPNGNIGIGTTAPTAKLDVNGSVNIASSNTYKINGTDVLSSTTLGSGVTGSSLASVGTLTTGVWNATAIAPQYGGTGDNTSATTGVPYISSGDWQYEASLDETRGGTGLSSYTTGDLLYGSGTNTLARLAVGTSSQCLIGGTTPSWGACDGAAASYWQLVNGTLYPGNSTVDLLIGATATSSAKFAVLNVNSGTPTASVSAGTNSGIYLTADGKIATTAKQNLTIGDSTTTGSVILNPNGNIGIGTTAPSAKLDVSGSVNLATGNTFKINGTDVLSGTTLGTGITSSSLTSVGTLTGGTWQGTAIGTQYGGTGQNFSSTAQGNIIYFSGTGAMAALAPSTAGFVLQTGGAGANPSWVDTNSGSFGLWQTLSGTIQPKNQTQDVLLGGTATTSAKFSVLNIAGSLTPVASLSGGLNGTNGVVLSAGGSLQSLNAIPLTIGGSTTGQVVLSGRNGANNGITLSGYGTGFARISSAGVVTSSAVDLASADVTGVLPIANGGSNKALTLAAGGVIYSDADSFEVSAAGNSGEVLTSGGTGAPTWTSLATNTTAGVFQILNGTAQPKNQTLDLLLGGTATSSAKFAFINVGSGTPTASISATTTGLVLAGDGSIQSLRMGALTLGGATTGEVVLDAGSSLIKLLDDTRITGDLAVNGGTSADITSTTTTASLFDAMVTTLSLGGAATTALNIGNGASAYTAINIGSGNGGNAINLGTGTGADTINIGTNATSANTVNIGTGAVANTIAIGGTSTTTLSLTDDNWSITAAGVAAMSLGAVGAPSYTFTGDLNTGLWSSAADTLNLSTGGSERLRIDSNGNVGVNTTAPLATLDVRYNTGTVPVASVSGVTSYAALTVDNTGVGDIFSASQSGVNRFVIRNAGNVGIGIALPNQRLEVAGNVRIAGGGAYFVGGTTGIDFTATCVTGFGGIVTSTASCPGGAGSNWNIANGAIFPNNAATLDLLIGGTATTSAKFAILNVNGSTNVGVTASVSGRLIVMPENGNLGQIGLGTTTPSTQLHITGDFTLAGGDILGPSSENIDLGEAAADTITLTIAGTDELLLTGTTLRPNADNGLDLGASATMFGDLYLSGGNINFGAATTIGDGGSGDTIAFSLPDNTTNSLDIQQSTNDYININTTDSSENLSFGNSTTNPSFSFLGSGNVGVGTATTLARLDVRGSVNTAPTASISADSTFASLVVTNTIGKGDLFTASASGATRFVIQNDGNVGIGTASATEKLTVAGNIKIEAQPNTANSQQRTWTKISGTAGTVGGGATTAIASISAMAVYNGSLYAGTTKVDGAEVYRYNGTSGSWIKVTQAAGTIASGGTANIDMISSMAVYNGYLYIGTQETNSAEVYRYEGGNTWIRVNSAAGTACSAINVNGIASMIVWNGKLYTGTREPVGAELCRYTGGTSWSRVNTAGAGTFGTTGIDALASMIVYHGSLYVGIEKQNSATQLQRFQGNTGNPGTAVQTFSLTTADKVSSLVVYRGQLFVGLNKPGSAIVEWWNSSALDNNAQSVSIWSTTGTVISGGTSAIDAVSSMVVYNNQLYMATRKGDSGEIYRFDGTVWTKVSQGIAGTIAEGGTSSIDGGGILQVYNGSLFAGTDEDNAGTGQAEVYQYTYNADQSYALKFHGSVAQAAGEQAGLTNDASIFFSASSSAFMQSQNAQTGTFVFSHGLVTQFGAYDVAEDYGTRDDTLEPGDVVSLDPNETGFVNRSSRTYDQQILGVFSEQPGLRLSQKDTAINGGEAIPVALIGRVQVNVSTENGVIKPGDYLTSSSRPGVAMKATKAGAVLGKAMEGYASQGIGKILVYLNTATFQGTTIGTITSGLQLESVSDQGLSIPASSQEILAKLLVQQSVIEEKPVNLSEIFTDRVVAGLEVITPRIATQDLLVERIKSSSESGQIALELSSDGQFIVTDKSGKPAITFDSRGNAFFAGTLTAEKIKANQIDLPASWLSEALQAGGLEIIESGITNQEARIKALEALVGSSSAVIARTETTKQSKEILNLVQDDTEVLTASDSAAQAEFDKLMAESYALLTDTASGSAVTIAGLTVDGDITVAKDLRVKEDGLFEGMLQVIDTITTRNLFVSGLTQFFGEVIFKESVQFEGPVSFNSDTAGYITVKKGEKTVDIVFSKSYEVAPVIQAQLVAEPLTDEEFTEKIAAGVCDIESEIDACQEKIDEALINANLRFAITKKSEKGFTIRLQKEAMQDYTFSWSALGRSQKAILKEEDNELERKAAQLLKQIL